MPAPSTTRLGGIGGQRRPPRWPERQHVHDLVAVGTGEGRRRRVLVGEDGPLSPSPSSSRPHPAPHPSPPLRFGFVPGETMIGPSKALFMDEISTGLDSSSTFQHQVAAGH
ncbi:uncharacterized protein LOC120651450 [Panicum virgatum]|uniref:uncharacterized protein LOC120651450 n=1 Tax=Panicum virgatum TaxID=38727 RepID=UPI0019D61459|nr:uncharacterized protein LOC120651450 [Panicum virgatum]